jgi:fluoroacetyl-CoA thioesterase
MKKTLKPGLAHRFTFKVKAHDGVDPIGEGRHQRYVVAWDKFNDRVANKAQNISVSA